MSVLERLASVMHRRDDLPNIALAKDLAERRDEPGIQEVAKNLSNAALSIRSDCIKVLYEIGYLKPDLISPYTGEFLKLLRTKENRLVWGGMIALSCVAHLQAAEVYAQLPLVLKTIENGTVITIDSGIRVLAALAAANEEYNSQVFPFILAHLRTCRPKDVAPRAESASIAVTDTNRAQFREVLELRSQDMDAAQMRRIQKLLK